MKVAFAHILPTTSRMSTLVPTQELILHVTYVMYVMHVARVCPTCQELILRAKRGVPSYSVLRIGKLKGSGVQKLELAPGDSLAGALSAAATSCQR